MNRHHALSLLTLGLTARDWSARGKPRVHVDDQDFSVQDQGSVGIEIKAPQ